MDKSNQDDGMTTKRTPIQRTCKSCGISFTISSGEQYFYESHQLDLPKRCKRCRENKKTQIAQDKPWKQDEIELSQLLLKSQYCQVGLSDLTLDNSDKSLIITGNGFDIMHGVKSSYWDFQNTLGKDSRLRYYLETYLDVSDL